MDILNHAVRGILKFFYAEDAFTFRGLLAVVLQLLGLFGALLGARFLLRRPAIHVTNVDPVGCIDLRAFKERFSAYNTPLPTPLTENLYALAGTQPSEKPVVVCWYHPARSTKREAEVLAAESRQIKPAPFGGNSDLPSIIADIRRELASATRPPSQFRGIDASPVSFFMRSKEFEPPNASLDVWRVLRPTSPNGPRSDQSAWAGWGLYDVGSTSVLDAIDSAHLQEVETKAALETLRGETWVINRIQVTNNSSHASVDRVLVEVDHSRNGPLEYLGGSLPGKIRGRSAFVARVDKLLPGESRVALLRTRWWSISNAGIRWTADPTPFFDPALGRAWLVPIVAVALLWGGSNLLLRTVLAHLRTGG